MVLALAVVTADPEDWRALSLLVEAWLLCPDSAATAPRFLERIALVHPDRPAAAPSGRGGVFVPCRLPHYAALEGTHPVFEATVASLPVSRLYHPRSWGTGLAARTLARLDLLRHEFEALLAIGPPVDRASAARYVASRFPSLLADPAGTDLDFLQHVPMRLGSRPFMMAYDVMTTTFQPFLPPEAMSLPAAEPGLFAILQHVLASPACRNILVLYRDAVRQLDEIFASPSITGKCVFINPPHSIDELGDRPTSVPPRPGEAGNTWLFTSSAATRPENFFLRGGVDVLNAFVELSEEDPGLRLILRSALPETLSPRLKDLVKNHPQIRFEPDPLDWGAYQAILRSADVFVMPSSGMFRNGLVQAMRWGLVPVISDCLYAEEMVQHGETGLIVRGRARHMRTQGSLPGFRSDWAELYRAVDRPADLSFYAELKSTLRNLGQDPERIRRISARNLATPATHESGEADHATLRRLFAQ
jgi:glycosyltransferase involved in cell wall biosynthesis